MFVKVTPNNKGTSGNSSSSANIFEYLDKENRETGQSKNSDFFDLEKAGISTQEAVAAIDKNTGGLTADESKFFMLSINPSANEMKHLCAKILGKKAENIKDLSPLEIEKIESELKAYTNQVMDLYAMNFNKGLRNTDLVYKAVVEHKRHYNHKDKVVYENKILNAEIRSLKKDLAIISDLKNYSAVVNSRIKNLENQLHKDLKTGQVIVYDQELLKNQQQTLLDKQQLSAMLEDKGMGIDSNTLSDLKANLFDAETTKEIKQYYDLNKALVWYKNGEGKTKIVSEKAMMENDRIQREIQNQKDLISIYSDKQNDEAAIKDRIELLKNKLHKDPLGRVVKEGLLKPGFNTHVHVVVSRKTKKLLDSENNRTLPSKKISPNANSKGHTQKNVDGSTRQTGFNHEQFKSMTNELFQEKFGYKSSATEKYTSKVTSAVNSLASNTMGEEFSKASNYSQKAIKYVKIALQANPKSLAINLAKETVLKPFFKVSQEFKNILLKGQTLHR